jgi:hypothetical protein
MTWGDGSKYKGTWLNGIQNGLGIISFSNGLKKAGIFKDNVLVEMLKTKDQILQSELELGVLPAEFKLELNKYIDEIDLKDDQAKYLSREIKKN